MDPDEQWMAEAIEVARRGWGDTHPNPCVGALLVAGGAVLARGAHRRAGDAHAEVEALAEWGGPVPDGATLYVTLEPCSSSGRTPPCTDAILKRGLKRVVVGAVDNDSRHRGRGLDLLRKEGVEVVSGVLEEECRDLNLIFHHRVETGRPLVAAKIATTIDGRTATADGTSKWITGEESRRDVHRWRRYFPAIGVGAGTVLEDDPRLSSRIGDEIFCPVRIVFDRSGKLAECGDRHVFTDSFRENTVVLTRPEYRSALEKHLSSSVRVDAIGSRQGRRVPLHDWLEEREIPGIYVEGGPRLLSDLFSAEEIDYLFAYRSPKLFLDDKARPPASGWNPGSPEDAISLTNPRHQTLGEDQLMRGFVRRRKP